MLDSVTSVGPSWATRNVQLLTAFAPLLLAAGVLGFVVPAHLSLMSGAPAYNIFHIVFGMIGTALVVGKSAVGVAAFNLGFGIVDVYQVVAGVTGVFPARQFRYKPADHVLHAVIGLALAVVGGMGLR